MRQIEDSLKVNHRNPPNEFERHRKFDSNEILITDNNTEFNINRKKSVKDLINKKCATICLNSKDLNFNNCFDNCELKLQKAENIFEASMKEYETFKKNHSL